MISKHPKLIVSKWAGVLRTGWSYIITYTVSVFSFHIMHMQAVKSPVISFLLKVYMVYDYIPYTWRLNRVFCISKW